MWLWRAKDGAKISRRAFVLSAHMFLSSFRHSRHAVLLRPIMPIVIASTCPSRRPRRISVDSQEGKKGWSAQRVPARLEGDIRGVSGGERAVGGADRHRASMYGATVDQAEVDKFGAIGEGCWDLGGMQKPLHSFNAIRIPFLQSMTAQHLNSARREGEPKVLPSTALKGLRIVDVGCGGGILAEGLCRLGADVLGIDAAGENIRIAERHARSMGLISAENGEDVKGAGRLEYRHVTAEHLHNEGHTFDLVVCSEVLEHVSDLSVMVRDLCRLVRRGGAAVGGGLGQQLRWDGALYVTTLNRTKLSYGLGILVND